MKRPKQCDNDTRLQLFRTMEVATIMTADADNLLGRDDFLCDDTILSILTFNGLVERVGYRYRITNEGWQAFYRGVRDEHEAAKCPVAELEIPIDF